jgi:hypothetical protein
MSKRLVFVARSTMMCTLLYTASAFASTITFSGPMDSNGIPCQAGSPHCVLGDPLEFNIFSAHVTQPTMSSPSWSLVIQTNYGAAIPGKTDVIPPFVWGADGNLYSISDFLITWNGNDYGIVLHSHVKAGATVDGYQAGSLYQTSGFQTSSAVIPGSPRPNDNVWLAAGGSLLSPTPGSVSGAQTGDGSTTGLYTITVQFSAPADFLSSGNFSIEMSSYVCANGLLIGTGNFGNSLSPAAPEPEPGTFFLMGAALLLLPRRYLPR